MSRKKLIVSLTLLVLQIASFLSLWAFWGKLAGGLAESFFTRLSSGLGAFLAFWLLFLAVWALFILLSKDIKLIIGGSFLVTVSLIGFVLQGEIFPPVLAAAAGIWFIGLLTTGLKLNTDVSNHVNFSAGHLLSPRFRGLGIFLALILSFYVYQETRPLAEDFRLTIPEKIIELISNQVAANLPGKVQGESTGLSLSLEEIDEFLEGRRPVSESLRPYLEGRGLPEEIKEQLRQQGMSPDLVEGFLSSIEVDENGYIRDPVTDGGRQIYTRGIKQMLEDQINQFLSPFRRYLPLFFAATCFMTLYYVNLAMVAMGTFLTWLLVKILLWTKIIVLQKEMVEAERLSVE